ncbi:MAG: hypothetical protein JWP74_2867 [Marmoricola sp.]|nr:hypothetical protein [Marmoricola sp.]
MTGNDEPDRRAREDADWQQIVESYGEAPEFPELPPEPVPAVVFEVPAELAGEVWQDPWGEDEDRYVPPPAPPLPRPRGARLLAWLGLFGVPTVVLVGLVVGISVPSYVGLLFLVWFVGGFGYLVATMNPGRGPNDPDSGWDDGAVL